MALGCLCLGPLCGPSEARAQESAPDAGVADDHRAEELFFLGDQLYSQGRYDAAITAFQESYRLSDRPLLLFNIANAQERAGRWDDAVISLRAWLQFAPVSERAAIESRIASIEARIRERDEANRPPEPEPEPEPEVQPEPPPPVEELGPRVSVPGVALVAAGGALAVIGAGFGIGSLHQRSVARDGCVTVGGETLCSGDVSGALDRNRAYAITADVTIAAGLAAAAVGLVLVLRSDDERGPEVTANPRPGGGVLTVAGSF